MNIVEHWGVGEKQEWIVKITQWSVCHQKGSWD